MTDGNAPRVGQVWRYPYLWSHEVDAGRLEGGKHRPAAVALLTANRDGEAVVMLVPLTTLEPENNPFALEVPETELRRAGLDPSVRAWVIANEYNFEAYRRTYYLEPRALTGGFTSMFIKLVQGRMIEAIKARKARGLAGTDGPATACGPYSPAALVRLTLHRSRSRW